MVPELRKDWIVFDGDNTLWLVEPLYDSARHDLCHTLSSCGLNAEEVDKFQRTRDAYLFQTMGYSRRRFPQSFEDTLRHFISEPDTELRFKVLALAERVFECDAPVPSDTDAVLTRLKEKFSLALFTGGELDVQQQRLRAFGRQHFFDEIRIVPRKDDIALAGLLSELGLEPQTTWVVGDSIRSDIAPALRLGLRAVHLESPNWHPVEIGTLTVPTGAYVARSLTEAASIIETAAIGPVTR